MRLGDTIVAWSSVPGRSARAVVRLSGVGAWRALDEFSRAGAVAPGRPGFPEATVGATRSAILLSAGLEGGELPVLVARFAGPRSYTGEDVGEILMPGNPTLVERVIARALACRSAPVRLAEPGEFTARAYLNGKLGVEQAEGVAALVASTSADELHAAGELMAGRTGRAYQRWADEITTLLALVEAGIDFTDQEDVRAISADDLRRRVGDLRRQIVAFLGTDSGAAARGVRPRVVLAGRPNAGKSTLFNALVGRRRSVESPVPGTTRDAISESLDLSRDLPGAGMVDLVDLAGLDGSEPGGASTSDRAAQRAALDQISRGDAVLYCDPTGRFETITDVPSGCPVVRVRTKGDFPGVIDSAGAAGDGAIRVCALDGWNLGVLRRAIADAATRSRAAGVAALVPRHARALTATLERLHESADAAGGDDPALTAGALRAALDAMGELVGRIDPDEVLGRVFSTFCVGK